MIRYLNRLYWLGYLAFAGLIYWVLRQWMGLHISDALVSSLSLLVGLLFIAHLGFHISGFALSFSVRQIPQVRDRALPFHHSDADVFQRLGMWRWVKAVAVESLHSVKLVTLLQPWAPNPDGVRLAGKNWRKKKPLPVLLVHGYLCNAAVWHSTRNLLDRADVSTHAITLEPAIGSIRSYSEAIHEAIDELLVATGAPQVKIVAHSMGGVAVRYHATEYGHHRIAGMITIGSPHFGTALSTLGVGKNVKQMAWGSFFLRTLREHPTDREFQKKIWSLWSPQDNIVCPPWSSKLEFGKNTAVPGCGHVSLISDSTTEDLILNWLAEDAQAYPLAENRA
ncbi:esterase/lipase family protein [Limnobacter sp.]|uniref:esterase/lipase family protein n=1 Tax=Limnobacter sp. TaxID=2003368 RepID=UPI003511DABE